MKSPNYKINELYNEHKLKYSNYYGINNNVKHKLLYDDKLKEVKHRIKLNHSIDRCINIDVAHGTLETIYAVFSIIKRLITNKIKGGLK